MNTGIQQRAAAIAHHSSLHKAVSPGTIAQYQDITVSEALVLGLLQQGVTRYFGIFGHGSTAIAEVLRIYEYH